MVSSESAVRWRSASSHQWRNWASLGLCAVLAFCRSSSSIAAIRVAGLFATRLGFGLGVAVEFLVGLDDALHQWMAHHVFGHEVGKGNTRYVLEHFDHMGKAGFGAAWQVDLGDITGDHRGGAKADAGQEHLHLFQGGVLAFVENDETIVQRATA